MTVLLRSIAGLVALVLVAGGAWAADKRVALVIGNAKYATAGPLANPANDAADIAAILKELEFDVLVGIDLDKEGMKRLIAQFAEKLRGADVGLFFYAGHGLQAFGQNYLLPTDVRLANADAVDTELLPLDAVQEAMREARIGVMILDACRNNPLGIKLAQAMGDKGRLIGRGLALQPADSRLLIAYATQPGNVALDGKPEDRNSPYTTAFKRHLPAKGMELTAILLETRKQVVASTGGAQVPWDHTSLTTRIFFPRRLGPFDGVWHAKTENNRACAYHGGEFYFVIEGGVVLSRPPGTVKPDGSITYIWQSRANQKHNVYYAGKLTGGKGSGSFHMRNTNCAGTVAMQRVSG